MEKDFSLLETILYTPDAGFFLLDEHIERLLAAMLEFNLLDHTLFSTRLTRQDITNELGRTLPTDDSCYRIRLLVDPDSNMHIEYIQLAEPEFSYMSLDEVANTEPIWNVVLDTEPISKDPDDPFIVHKTTKRDVYNDARERTKCDWNATDNQPFDVVLWNKHKHITETSIANIAVRFVEGEKYRWKTPKLECGLLPGVFRAFLLLHNQDLIEDVITIDELKDAQRRGHPIVCFNSVRKLYKVNLLDS